MTAADAVFLRAFLKKDGYANRGKVLFGPYYGRTVRVTSVRRCGGDGHYSAAFSGSGGRKLADVSTDRFRMEDGSEIPWPSKTKERNNERARLEESNYDSVT